MIQLIVYQFQYSKRQWLGTIPLLFVSSLIIGTSLIGMSSRSTSSIATPVQLFQMLMIFGGTTLFFLISNNTKLLIELFQKDYELWSILGASKSQLSFLVAGQFFLMAMIVSAVGTGCSLIITDRYYKFLQHFLGRDELPDLMIRADVLVILLSIFIVPTIAGMGAYFYSRRILAKDEASGSKLRRINIRATLTKIGSLSVCVSLWGVCVYLLMSDVSSKSIEEISLQTSVILFLLLLHLLIIQILSPFLQILFIKLLMKIFPNSHYAINTGFWNLLHNPSYLKSLQTSVTMGVTLISGFILYTQNMYVFMNNVNSIQEARASFIAYMSAPIALILASIISITILSSNQDIKDVTQLRILGMSKKQLLKMRVAEAIIHIFLILIVSVVFNSIILFFVNYSGKLLGQELSTVSGYWLPTLIVLGLLAIFYIVTKGIYILKDR